MGFVLLAAFGVVSVNGDTAFGNDFSDPQIKDDDQDEVHTLTCKNNETFNLLKHNWDACDKRSSHVIKCPKLTPIVCAIQLGGATACAQIKEDCLRKRELGPDEEPIVGYENNGTNKCFTKLPLECGDTKLNPLKIIDEYKCSADADVVQDMSKVPNDAWKGCEQNNNNNKEIEQCPNNFPIECERNSGAVKCGQNLFQCENVITNWTWPSGGICQEYFTNAKEEKDFLLSDSNFNSLKTQNELQNCGPPPVCTKQETNICRCPPHDNHTNAKQRVKNLMGDDETSKKRFDQLNFVNPRSENSNFCRTEWRREPVICTDNTYTDCGKNKIVDETPYIPIKLVDEHELADVPAAISELEQSAGDISCTQLLNLWITRISEPANTDTKTITSTGQQETRNLQAANTAENSEAANKGDTQTKPLPGQDETISCKDIQILKCGRAITFNEFKDAFKDACGNRETTVTQKEFNSMFIYVNGGEDTIESVTDTLTNFKFNLPNPDSQNPGIVPEYARLPYDDQGQCEKLDYESCVRYENWKNQPNSTEEKYINFISEKFYDQRHTPISVGRRLAVGDGGNSPLLVARSSGPTSIFPYFAFYTAVPQAPSLLWLWILLGVVGILILLLVAALLAQRRNKAKAPVVFEEDAQHGIGNQQPPASRLE